MQRFLTAVAAIALVAGSGQVMAQGNGKGNGKGGGGQAAAGPKQGGGGQGRGQGNGNGNGNADRGGGPSMAQSMRSSDGQGNGRGQGGGSADRGGGQGKGGGNADRGGGGGQGNARSGDNRVERVNDRGRGNNDRVVVERGRGNDRTVVIDDRGRGRGNADRVVVLDDRHGFSQLAPRGLINGCPPGLAKKNNGCRPPGQARHDYVWSGYARPDWWGLGGLGDGRYFYRDGYLLAPSGGYIPLLGGALGIGNIWPTYYQPVRVPAYYESYYDLGPYDAYRYADNVIYRVDPQTAAITSVAALLTGDDFVIGQQMPRGYDVYNVPYGYRTQYVDGPDAYYRYSDGYVYQVDPETRLVAAAIELLAS